jgi:hypothetical protein
MLRRTRSTSGYGGSIAHSFMIDTPSSRRKSIGYEAYGRLELSMVHTVTLVALFMQ